MSLFELYVGNNSQNGWQMDTAGAIGRMKSGALYATAGYFVPLTAPLTSTSWDGDAYSTVGTSTLLDLSAVFGAPGGIKAVLMYIACRDSASPWGTAGAAGYSFQAGPSSTWWNQVVCRSHGLDLWADTTAIVSCNSNGDFYYRINASGASTLDVYLRIWGYWL